ncbi:MAG: NADH-quinone oxidoreductase subunit N [Nitrospinota bacterium]
MPPLQVPEWSRSLEWVPLAAPELAMTLLICAIFVADLFTARENKARLGVASLVGVVLVALLALLSWGQAPRSTFGGLLLVDNFAVFMKLVVLLGTGLSILISLHYLKVERINLGEFYGLLLSSALGMMIMAAGGDLITIYLGLELMSISIYILVGFIRHDELSREAALKYFLMGAFTSGVLLYGMALVYGLTGYTDLRSIAGALAAGRPRGLLENPALILGLIMMVAGFGFKIALVPFHMWVPDAYTGAPTSVTAFMSVGTKAAAFAGLMRIFLVALEALGPKWNLLLWSLAAFTMLWGNIAAIVQSNLKRMLAYSSIAHAGYALMGLVASLREDGTFSSTGMSAVLFYLVVYTFTNVGAFAMVILLCREGFRGDRIEDFQALGRTSPWAALIFVVFFLSLAGLPPTAGFVGKLYLFAAAIEQRYVWLAVIGVVGSAIGIYYYFRVVMVMYMYEPKGPAPILQNSPSLLAALFLMVALTFALAIFPGAFIDAARDSVTIFLPPARTAALPF